MAKNVAVKTFAEAKELMGKKAVYEFKCRPKGSVHVEVRIKDIKVSWGHSRFLIEPVAGQGELWVENLQMAS